VRPKNVPIMRQFLKMFPYIVQLSFVTYDTELDKTDFYDYVIKIPRDIEVTPESIELHGITREVMDKRGVDIKVALNEFKKCYLSCNTLVAHNLKFDNTMITVESMRNNMGRIINIIDPKKTHYCTMNNSINLCNIIIKKNDKTYKKFPKQLELHQKLFTEKIREDKLHDSSVDILLCLRCYFMMEHEKDILECSKSVLMPYYEHLFIR
jgi:DNA polymerase III epsilon subunit-like protein